MPSATLTVHPGRALTGELDPPGDKSISHRACLLALLAHGTSRLAHANPGADVAATLAACRRLGAEVHADTDEVRVIGPSGRLAEPDAPIDCGNSGTTLRLLAGVVAGHDVLVVMSGDASLNARPVRRVLEPLRRMGAVVEARAGGTLPPLVVHGGTLRPITWTLDVASAQVASCVLFAGLAAAGETVVELPGPARDHTERMLAARGVPVTVTGLPGGGRRLAVRGPARPRAADTRVPGDFSAAAFFLAAAAATPGGDVLARGVSLNPTRTGLLDVLERMGAAVERTERSSEGGEPVGDVRVRGPERLAPFDVPAEWVPRLVDEVPAWTIAAAAAGGTSRLTGAAELRVKESDRLAVLARNLATLGIAVEERPDGLAVTGGTPRGGTVAADGDHRIAMAFAVLGSRARGPVTVRDTAAIATSYPGFAADFARLGGVLGDVVAAGRRS